MRAGEALKETGAKAGETLKDVGAKAGDKASEAWKATKEATAPLAEKVADKAAVITDKAIDVIDEAGARVRLKAMTRPPDLKELDEQIERLVSEGLERASASRMNETTTKT